MKIEVTQEPDGRLKISAAPEHRNEMRERLKQVGFWGILSEMYEPYSTNGSYAPFDAGDGNPFVGLTSAPCIAEAMTTKDDGSNEINGKLWWFPNYAIECPVKTLINTGVVNFEKP